MITFLKATKINKIQCTTVYSYETLFFKAKIGLGVHK